MTTFSKTNAKKITLLPTVLNSPSHVAVARTMCHVGTKKVRPSIAPSSEAQWGLTPTEPLHPYFYGSTRRDRSDRKKLSIPSSSRTLAARRGAPPIKLLAGPDTPRACTPSRQTLSLRNSRRTGHTRRGTASPQNPSTRRRPSLEGPRT